MATVKKAAPKKAAARIPAPAELDLDQMIEEANANVDGLKAQTAFTKVERNEIAKHQRTHTIAAINQHYPDHGYSEKELHEALTEGLGIVDEVKKPAGRGR